MLSEEEAQLYRSLHDELTTALEKSSDLDFMILKLIVRELPINEKRRKTSQKPLYLVPIDFNSNICV